MDVSQMQSVPNQASELAQACPVSRNTVKFDAKTFREPVAT